MTQANHARISGENLPFLTPDDVLAAEHRIAPYIHRTPLLSSSLLDDWLGHRIIFKAEGLQKIGAFKMRGAINTLLALKEQGRLPQKIVAYSSGNHAQAVAYAASRLGAEATIMMARYVAPIKRQAAAHYGAQVHLEETRADAIAAAHALQDKGYFLLPPYDHDDVIAGQGTACLEALQDSPEKPDAVFATCSGGGLVAGTWIAAQISREPIAVYGAEPLNANDAARSFREGRIISFEKEPETVADGARALCMTPRTFQYIRRLDGMVEAPEKDIIYWTQWLTHLLKTLVEPTAATAMASAARWLKTQPKGCTVLVILSGGNVDPAARRDIWGKSLLETTPDVYTQGT